MSGEKTINPGQALIRIGPDNVNLRPSDPLRQELAQKAILLEKALKKAAAIQNQYDRQSYFLKVFFTVNHKLSRLRDKESMLENFLRLTMESMGIEEGGVFLFNIKEKQSLVKYQLGGKEIECCSEEQLGLVRAKLDEWVNNQNPLFGEPFSLNQAHLSELKIPSPSLEIALAFTLSESYWGLVVLGKRLDAQAYIPEEEEFLKNLTNNLAILLDRANALEKIQALHADMEQRNVLIQKTFVDLNVSENRLKVLEKAKPQFRQAVKKELERSRRVSVLDFVMILGLGLVLGIIFNLANPGGIPLIPVYWFQETPARIGPQEARQIIESGGAILVDARPDTLYRQGHIKGAFNLPLAVFDFIYLMKFSHLDPKKEIIVYGRHISRRYDLEVALLLKGRGHRQVKILSGGLSSWQKGGFPLEP
jgi:rhodanese-related sulfurtransferase